MREEFETTLKWARPHHLPAGPTDALEWTHSPEWTRAHYITFAPATEKPGGAGGGGGGEGVIGGQPVVVRAAFDSTMTSGRTLVAAIVSDSHQHYSLHRGSWERFDYRLMVHLNIDSKNHPDQKLISEDLWVAQNVWRPPTIPTPDPYNPSSEVRTQQHRNSTTDHLFFLTLW